MCSIMCSKSNQWLQFCSESIQFQNRNHCSYSNNSVYFLSWTQKLFLLKNFFKAIVKWTQRTVLVLWLVMTRVVESFDSLWLERLDRSSHSIHHVSNDSTGRFIRFIMTRKTRQFDSFDSSWLEGLDMSIHSIHHDSKDSLVESSLQRLPWLDRVV